MFDVQAFYWSKDVKFHTSAAAGLKSGQSDQERNSKKANNE
jgi:hypothetical protein